MINVLITISLALRDYKVITHITSIRYIVLVLEDLRAGRHSYRPAPYSNSFLNCENISTRKDEPKSFLKYNFRTDSSY